MGTLVEALLDPLAWPAPRPAEIELRETHVSWVFLTEREALKVKKPVDLGFLDFTSVERRREACEAEVTLNRRLAPSVYLGVVPVCRDAEGHLNLRGEGEVVDHAVKMVRLPDAARADVLLSQGALTVAWIDRLAARLAAFHEGARHDGETARMGAPEAVLANVSENFQQSREALKHYLTAAQAEELERWQRAVVRDRDALLRARAEGGRVRDGHGDLRLEHVYLGVDGEGPSEGAVTVLDCVEFSPRYRYEDVAADVAFVSMDLAWHGRVDLAERLLSRYAMESNDYDLYAVADFYQSYRAHVRAKLAALVASDPGVTKGVREQAERDARRYFLLALASDRRALIAPSVVAVGGIIASGKSTVAGWLSDELAAPVVEADRTRKSMLGVAATEPVRDGAFQGAYDPAFTERVYAEVLRRAEVVLDSGRPVILDASFRSASLRARARALATARGVPFHFVECRVAPEVCHARLVQRASEGGVSDGRLEILADFVARFESVRELPEGEHLPLDTGLPRETTLALLRRGLDAWPRGLVG